MRIPEELVERAVRTGEREALAALVAAAQGDIFHLLLSRLGNAADAEDATQETFRQVLESLGNLREPKAFAGWIYRIALDKARRARRSRSAEKQTLGVLAARASASGEDIMHPAETAETREKVREAVGQLDDDLRTAVELRYEHDLSYAEIAEATEVPEGTVARRLHTAHGRLQKALAGVGVVLATAMLERELAAAPRAEAPRPMARRIERMARERGMRPKVPGKHARLGIFAAAATLLILGVPAGLVLRATLSKNRSSETGKGNDRVATQSKEPGAVTADPSSRDGHTATEMATAPPEAAPPAAGQGALAGRVLASPDGPPIPGATIRFLDASTLPRKVAAAVTTDADGKWRVDFPVGGFIPVITAPGYLGWEMEKLYQQLVVRGSQGMYVVIEGIVQEYDLVIQPTLGACVPLGGVVVGENGLPCPGVEVRVAEQDVEDLKDPSGFKTSLRSTFPVKAVATVVTDASGRFVFPSVLARGRVMLRADQDATHRASATVDLKPEGNEVKLTLGVETELSGVVLDPIGQPVGGALLFWLPESADENPFLCPLVDRSDAQGAFRLPPTDLRPRWIVGFTPGRGPGVLDYQAAGAAETGLRLPGKSATLRGVVHDPEGAAIPGAMVWVDSFRLSRDGFSAQLDFPRAHPAWPRYVTPGRAIGELPESLRPAPETTGADGSFAIAGLPLHGSTSVHLLIEATGWKLKSVDVVSNEVLDIEMVR